MPRAEGGEQREREARLQRQPRGRAPIGAERRVRGERHRSDRAEQHQERRRERVGGERERLAGKAGPPGEGRRLGSRERAQAGRGGEGAGGGRDGARRGVAQGARKRGRERGDHGQQQRRHESPHRERQQCAVEAGERHEPSVVGVSAAAPGVGPRAAWA